MGCLYIHCRRFAWNMSASAILQVSYCKLDQINRQLTLLCATAETCALEIPNYCVKYNLKC